MSDQRGKPGQGGPPGGGGHLFYLLGIIGAAVWFWHQADGAGEHFVGVLKALVWPAYLVYEAFKALEG